MADIEPPTFAVGEKCLCYHGPLIYEAKVIKSQHMNEETSKTGYVGIHYLVHYKGWKQTWDEFVPAGRLLKITENNVALQKSLQAQAQAQNAAATASANKAKGKDAAGTSAMGNRGGRKRGRDDDEPRKPEMKLVMPELLKAILVDDWEAVTTSNQLVTLPRTPTVAQLLNEFEEYVKREKPAGLREPEVIVHTVVQGLLVYFDRSLGHNLLYRFERPQYAEIRKKYLSGPNAIPGSEPHMSEIYGAEHFLRLLVNLPQMIAASSVDQDTVVIIGDYAAELLRYMERERGRIFQVEYDTASVPYLNISRS
ncbi:MRG-domain-containing protein [Mycena floridula]|nr:MRG-domain-containing protein [Mycena floridula]